MKELNVAGAKHIRKSGLCRDSQGQVLENRIYKSAFSVLPFTRAHIRAGRPARPCPLLRRGPLSLDRITISHEGMYQSECADHRPHERHWVSVH